MKRYSWILLLLVSISIHAQVPADREKFFLAEEPIEVSITTDIKNLRTQKKEPQYQVAKVNFRFTENDVIEEDIRLMPRGEFRKNNCDIAALMLNFNNPSSPKLAFLKKLKLVGGCNAGLASEQLLLKEYLTYKIFNQLTDMSFRVRLLHVRYNDSRGKMKPYSQYAFVIEDVDDMAKRNNCVEVEGRKYFMEQTNREHMTMIGLFQYMIGNTDFSVPNYHNIKLIVNKNDTLSRPFVVPYDFDYCGIVNADYAIPSEMLGIANVKDRLYRAYSRSMEELQVAITLFNSKKSNIVSLVNNFHALSSREKKEMSNYIESFYNILGKKSDVEAIFINNAVK